MHIRRSLRAVILALATAPMGLVAACDSSSPGLDASSGGGDAGRDASEPNDSGTPSDAGEPSDASEPSDAGEPSDGGSPVDAGLPMDVDASAPEDAGAEPDAGSDAGVSDAGVSDAGVDAGASSDAGMRPDAAGACHAYGLEVPSVSLRTVATLPAMTGGTIPLGTYDAVDAQTTGSVSGTYRATWVFESATTLQLVQQLTLSGTPPAATPRTYTWSTAGATLSRMETCPSSMPFMNEYRVRDEGGVTFLDVRQAGLMFTFRRR